MTFPRTSLISALVVATALLASCGDDDDTAADTTTAEVTEPTAADTEDESTTSDTTVAEAGDEMDAEGGDDVVIMEDSRFMPETLEVATGAAVTWENTDPYAHTVTSAEGSAVEFDSGELAQDETFSQTFDEAGTYEYICEIHPTMRAEVVVS